MEAILVVREKIIRFIVSEKVRIKKRFKVFKKNSHKFRSIV